jgi:hypothetical protein
MGQLLEQDAETPVEAPERQASARSLVLVAGSGRSGTSVFSGLLQRLGFYVPQPEVPADETNPRGFAESQWVVDFHTRLLTRTRVQTSDARPSAWAKLAHVALDEAVRQELRSWVKRQFREADHVIIKDPRLSWFLPLWRRCAEEVGVVPRFATMLRHPAAVIESKQRWYGSWQGDVSRAAGWLNQVLFTERATREAPRVFVRYDDLIDDWARTIDRVGKALELDIIADASWTSMVRAQQFLDPSLSRSRATWDAFTIPAHLRRQAEEVWELVCRLAVEEEGEVRSVIESLDAQRAAYVQLYEEAEAIAQSSVWAAARPQRHAVRRPFSARAARAVPRRLRRKVPLRWRRAVARRLGSRK